MRWFRNVLGLAVLFIALTFVVMMVLGNSIDRDRDASLGSSSGSGGLEPTATVTLIPADTPLTRATVERVSDGDTIRVRIGTSVETLRLIGINAPEMPANAPSDCLAVEAREFLVRLIEGKTVYLESDVNNRDQYRRLLRYVWLPKGEGYLMVNQLLVGRGLAMANTYWEDDKHASTLARTELDAIASKSGIWGSCISSFGQGTAGAPETWDGSSDLDCRDFATRVNAQAFYAAMGGPASDPHNLDVDRNGLVCHGRPPTEPT